MTAALVPELYVLDIKRSLHGRFAAACAAIISPLEDRPHARRQDTVCVRQFVVADPDGYLLRFAEQISE